MVDNHTQIQSLNGEGVPQDELSLTPLLTDVQSPDSTHSPLETIGPDFPQDKLLLPLIVAGFYQEKRDILTTITTCASEEPPPPPSQALHPTADY